MRAGGAAGVVSRSVTAPVDRAKMLMQVESTQGLSMRQAFGRMLGEGSIRHLFKGNGANCAKVGPEMALKMTLNDEIKRIYTSRLRGGAVDDLSPLERLVIGGTAGAIGQVVIYPMEVVKVRLAVTPHGTYSGIWDVLRRVRRKEGVPGLYRGLVPSLLGIFPYAGCDIMMFEMLKARALDHYDDAPPGYVLFACGAFSSSVAQFVSYPFALVRTRLQAMGGPNGVQYAGMLDAFRKTVAGEGVRGLYKGLTPNMLKLAPAAAVSWYTFEQAKLALDINIRT